MPGRALLLCLLALLALATAAFPAAEADPGLDPVAVELAAPAVREGNLVEAASAVRASEPPPRPGRRVVAEVFRPPVA